MSQTLILETGCVETSQRVFLFIGNAYQNIIWISQDDAALQCAELKFVLYCDTGKKE